MNLEPPTGDTDAAVRVSRRQTHARSRRYTAAVVATTFIAAFLLGAHAAWPPSVEAPESYVVRRGVVPDVQPVAALAEAEAAPAEEPAFGVPVRLRIPHIDVDAPVVEVGRTADNVMEAPEGPVATGWYGRGPRPGEMGSAVIAGHRGYRVGTAVFDDLGTLRPGDLVHVFDEAGGTVAFRVAESRRYRPWTRAPEVFSRDDGRYLNLITCAGEWDAAAGTHTERLVVFCEAVEASAVE